MLKRYYSLLVLAVIANLVSLPAMAQFPLTEATNAAKKPGAPPAAPPTPRAGAYVDLTGYWVSVVTEDWAYRMLMPAKGDAGSLPVNGEAKKAAEHWDPSAATAADQACRLNGAAGNIRRPGRLHITWVDEKTLKVDFSAGQQTRILSFSPPAGDGGAKPSWQGQSTAEWVRVRNWQQFGPPSIAPVGGALKVSTDNMLPGYLQANGFPYSANTKMTEYFDRVVFDGTPWLIVTTVVEDPTYLRDKLYWSTPFKQEKDGTRWKEKSCGEL